MRRNPKGRTVPCCAHSKISRYFAASKRVSSEGRLPFPTAQWSEARRPCHLLMTARLAADTLFAPVLINKMAIRAGWQLTGTRGVKSVSSHSSLAFKLLVDLGG
jgi:hypothetical protein